MHPQLSTNYILYILLLQVDRWCSDSNAIIINIFDIVQLTECNNDAFDIGRRA